MKWSQPLKTSIIKPNVPERNEEINRVERATWVKYFIFMRGVTSTGLGYVGR